MKKYEFTGETKVIDDVTVHQIRALVDFSDVLAGDIGGWIEKEENLSHDGVAWVSSTRHVLAVGPIGSRDEFTTFYRDRNNEITVKCGCFLGKIDVFLDKVADTHGDSKRGTVYRAAAALAKLQIDRGETTP